MSERTYSEIITVVSPEKAWRYTGCDEHLDWFIAASRECGDQFTYYRFHCDPDRVTCIWCLGEAAGKAKEDVREFNQVSSEVHRPAPKDEPCDGTVGSKPWWMGDGQYDPCHCKLLKGHKGKCECEHGTD